MTPAKTPAEAVAEAREKLWEAVNGWRGSFSPAPAYRACENYLAAFAAAVRAEAFEEMRAEADGRRSRASERPGIEANMRALAYRRMADWAKQQAEKVRQK